MLLGASGDVGRHVPRGSIGNLVGVANREISAADGLDVHACLELTSRYLGSIFANIRRRLGRFRVQRLLIKGAFLVKDDRVLKGPLGRSLRSFACTAHSAHSLRSAPLRYARLACSLRSRACSLTLLTPLWDS